LQAYVVDGLDATKALAEVVYCQYVFHQLNRINAIYVFIKRLALHQCPSLFAKLLILSPISLFSFTVL
jgi:hypothetical protein